jgi:hypothetical protein
MSETPCSFVGERESRAALTPLAGRVFETPAPK